ncbi:kinesin-domain-containing protein, partial [Ramicandelaber brevisporus]
MVTLPVKVAVRIRPVHVGSDSSSGTSSEHGAVSPSGPGARGRHAFLNGAPGRTSAFNEVVQVSNAVAHTITVSSTGAGGAGGAAGVPRSFSFDYVFGPRSTQSDVYTQAAVPLLDKFVEGYNATILAYGQTSSGKTHTMGTGMPGAYTDAAGIVPRTVETLFQYLRLTYPDPRSGGAAGSGTYRIAASFLELYNEELVDLLAFHDNVRPTVHIREDPNGNIIWTGVKEVSVDSVEGVLDLLQAGSAVRQTGSTEMNEKSSRSHAIFSLTLQQERWGGGGDAPVMIITSKFHFVDLAGSERLKRTQAVGERAREGISINAGLLALGNVISALGDPSRKASHVPYRDSKLTRLLQDSLGGNAQTLMIACVSPVEANVVETLNTLKYANRARNIKNSAGITSE